jgi:hypothetical protein
VEWCLHGGAADGTGRRRAQVPETEAVWDALRRSVTADDGANSGSSEDRLSSCAILLKKLPRPSNRPRYVEIASRTATLADALRDMTVIEYPTFDVVPASRLDEFPRLLQSVDTKEGPKEEEEDEREDLKVES